MTNDYRTVVNMNNSNALITKAMLASYISEKQMDYLSMIEPFVIHALPKKIGQSINIDEIIPIINEASGLELKYKIIEKILIRLSKDKKGSLIKRETINRTTIYKVKNKLDTSDFDNKKREMKNLVCEVVEKLRNFINDDSIIKRYSTEEAQKALISFLNKYNYELYINASNLEKIQTNESAFSDNFKVAKFIISEYELPDGCFDKIRQIQEGYFASVALYYFFISDGEVIDKKKQLLKDTKVILDTMLLVDSLKLNTVSKSNAMEDLLILIHDNGGELYTFDYYIRELKGIIKKYIEDPSSRIMLDLDFFRRNKMNTAEIYLFIQNIDSSISENSSILLDNNLKIKIIEEPDYTDLIENKDWHINYLELEDIMIKIINYQYGKEDTAFKNDFKTLQAISYFNEKEKNNSIFITTNRNIIKSAIQFYNQDNASRKFFSDIDLTAKLWLSSYSSKSKLSELVLLENAYAALSPNTEILSEVLKVIDNNINCDDEKIRNDAILLRNDIGLRDYISEVTQNDKNLIDDHIQQKLIIKQENRLKQELKVEVEKEVKKEYQLRQKEIEQLDKNLNSKKYKLENKDTKLIQKEQKLYEREKMILDKQDIISQLKQDSLKKEQRLNDLEDNEKGRIKNISKFISKASYCFLKLIIMGVAFFIGLVCISFTIRQLVDNDLINNYNQYISIILTVIGLIPLYNSTIKFLKKLSNKVEDYIYNYLCKHSNILNLGE